MSDDREFRLEKIAAMSSTQPLYETKGGKEFTISDIVQNKVKPPDVWPSGSMRGKSLSYRFRLKNKKKSDRENNIKKNSYRSDIDREEKPIKNMPVVNYPKDEHSFSGFVPNDITVMDDEVFSLNDDNYLDKSSLGDNLLNYLIYLSNKLDKNNQHSMANFTDFLIKKFAIANNIDYVSMFNDIILKINDSDVDLKLNLIKEITKKFSYSVSKNIKNGKDIDESKRIAYEECLSEADGYMV